MIGVLRFAGDAIGFALAWWLAGWIGVVIFFLGCLWQCIDDELDTVQKRDALRKKIEDDWRYR